MSAFRVRQGGTLRNRPLKHGVEVPTRWESRISGGGSTGQRESFKDVTAGVSFCNGPDLPMAKRLPTRIVPSRSTSFELLESRLLYSTYDIQGVQAAAIDQPQVYAIFRNSPTGNPLGGNGPDDGYAVKSYLDTGASGILLSQEAAASDALNLTRATFNGEPVHFTDIGVAGGAEF